jgi:GT2 family glycosyltransferase
VIELGVNRGFACAVNRGIAAASTPLVAVLNNDVRLEPTWLERLCAAIVTDPTVGFATGKIYRMREQGILDGAFDAVCRGACAWRCGNGRRDSEVWSQPRPIQMAPLTAAVARRELFTAMGPLDESLESYLEDIEFGMRCALAGRGGVYVPSAVARHWGSATLGLWHPATVRRIARNQVFLIATHYPTGWVARYGWPVLVGQLLYGLLALRHGAAWGYVRGKWEGVRGYRRRRAQPADSHRFAAMIQASEQTIRELQRSTGSDWYWKIYFAVT